MTTRRTTNRGADTDLDVTDTPVEALDQDATNPKPADDDVHDGHTIDMGAPSSTAEDGKDGRESRKTRRANRSTGGQGEDSEQSHWLQRREDGSGTWEVWGYIDGRPAVLHVSGRDQDQALRDLDTIRAASES